MGRTFDNNFTVQFKNYKMKTKVIGNQYFFTVKNLIFIISLLIFNLIFTKSNAQRTPWITPEIAKEVKNPIAVDKSSLAEGKLLYSTNCTPCHGDKGKGDGPAAQALAPKPADHTSSIVQNETDGSLFWKLSEGRNPMPGYKKILTDKQRWELVNYIRTLSKTGNKGTLSK
jgi:mono/diheme cytochrome c family protein